MNPLNPALLTYAGIGSRKTPDPILKVMHYIGAYLHSQGWTLRSGGAIGADAAFEQGVNHMNYQIMRDHPDQDLMPWEKQRKQIYLPWRRFNNHDSPLHPGNIPFTDHEQQLARHFHPAWHKCSPSAKLMMQRNVRQIIGSDAVDGPDMLFSCFVVCWTPGGEVTGGTGQSLRMAQAMNVPIVNLGKAQSNEELEAMVLEIDKIQNRVKQLYASLTPAPEPAHG